MATIVKIRGKDYHAILLGVGYGMFEASRPGMIFGDLFPSEKSGESMMAAVSTSEGKILWCNSEDLEVVEVDGDKPSTLLSPYFVENTKH